MERRTTLMYNTQGTIQDGIENSSTASFGRQATMELQNPGMKKNSGTVTFDKDFFKKEAMKQDLDMPYEKTI
jgi:hypothetical protein